MTKELITDGDLILSIVLRDKDYPPGLHFYNNDQDFIQVGTWNYPKGQKIKPHIHILGQKNVNRTQEVLYIKVGKVRTNIYNENGQFIKAAVLDKGDWIIQLAGGHDFEILEDHTQVLMVKNGPYLGVEKDKKHI